MDQVLKKAGRIPEQILGKVSIAVSVLSAPRGGGWVGVHLSSVMQEAATPGLKDVAERSVPGF